MSDSIVGVMKKVAENEVQRVHTTELGIVTAQFPHSDDGDKDNYQCSVKLKNKKLPDGSDFELRQVPVAAPFYGWASIPDVGSLVLVSFIGGDINAPIITGVLYNDEDRPPVNKKQEILLQHTIKDGPSIKLDDQGTIILTSKNKKNVLTVTDEKISVVADKFSMVIDASGNKITLASNQDMELNASNGKLTLNATQIEMTASGAMKLKGATIDLN